MKWEISSDLIDYPQALKNMEETVALLKAGGEEKIWLLEHPHLFTAGTSAKAPDLLDSTLLPVFQSGRGGQFTYHGPGQRVAYVMIDLSRRQKDLKLFIYALEQWVIDTLAIFNIIGERRPGRVGIWIDVTSSPRKKEAKIAAIGVRVSQWVSYHGIAINVNPDLSYYEGIIPCGLKAYDVTSLAELGRNISLNELDKALQQAWDANAFLRGIR